MAKQFFIIFMVMGLVWTGCNGDPESENQDPNQNNNAGLDVGDHYQDVRGDTGDVDGRDAHDMGDDVGPDADANGDINDIGDGDVGEGDVGDGDVGEGDVGEGDVGDVDESCFPCGDPDENAAFICVDGQCESACLPGFHLDGGDCVQRFRRLHGGDFHVCGINSADEARCWGHRSDGQLGADFDFFDSHEVVHAGELENIVSIAAGGGHSCAILSGGSVECWGANDRGQLGDGTIEGGSEPRAVVELGGSAVAISAGRENTCAVLDDGTVKCWGAHEHGMLGTEVLMYQDTPVQVEGISDAVDIVAGIEHVCALLSSGKVMCWGNNSLGQLGSGNSEQGWQAQEVVDLSDASELVAGLFHSCAMTIAGEVKCWGGNTNGELGDDSDSFLSDIPVTVYGSLENWQAQSIGGGTTHICVVTRDEDLLCWGANGDGQLGDGTTNKWHRPVQVAISGVQEVTGGVDFTCARLGADQIKCWGNNFRRQLGDGTSENRTTPGDDVADFASQ